MAKTGSAPVAAGFGLGCLGLGLLFDLLQASLEEAAFAFVGDEGEGAPVAFGGFFGLVEAA